jgi:amidohydrolase
METIKRWLADHAADIQATYRTLHEMAEVSWQEKRTTAFLCRQLEDMGVPYQTFDDMTGVVATWEGSGGSKTVAMRADIDALFQNVDGEWKANHSCGHDAHMTMVLHALRCLKETGFAPKGRLKVIFQPAEETGRGAMAMLEKGVLDDVDHLIGIHLRPVQEMSYGKASPAIYHGATTHLTGKIRGVQSHAARPHLGVNVVDSLGAIIAAVNAVKVDPTVPASAKVTHVHAGSENGLNTIPDEAVFGLDLRAQTNAKMDELLDKVKHAVLQAGTANGAEVTLEQGPKMAAAVPNASMEEVVRQAIADLLGPNAVTPPPVTPGGEDFHFYSVQRPAISSTMVGLGAGLRPGLHHPNMEFERDSLQMGAGILAASVVKIFMQEGEREVYSRGN